MLSHLSHLRQHPIQALRAQFHLTCGTTDTQKAAEFFGVNRRTVQMWVSDNRLPNWAIQLLSIHSRGYLPDNQEWEDFAIIGDRLHFHGYFGFRSVTPNQLKRLDFIAPKYEPNSRRYDDNFWNDYFKGAHKTPVI